MKTLVLLFALMLPSMAFAQSDSLTKPSSHYSEAGLIVGSPSGFLNLMGAYECNRFGIVFTAGYFSAFAFHISVPYRFYSTPKFSAAICLTYENSYYDTSLSHSTHFVDIGPSIEIKWHWFFVETGILMPLNSIPAGLGTWQIGYVYKFD
jgi:hypothetical protein